MLPLSLSCQCLIGHPRSDDAVETDSSRKKHIDSKNSFFLRLPLNPMKT